MAITATKKFNWTDEDQKTNIYFPGMVIEDQSAAAWAKMQGYAEERGEQIEARAMRGAPENKATDINVGKKKGGKRNETAPEPEPVKRADDGEGNQVLGTEDEIAQES